MGLNVSTTMGFENKEFLKNAAKNLLSNSGASPESSSRIVNGTIFDYNSEVNPQLSIIKASAQITSNKSLDETLRYLKSHAAKKSVKSHTFGELWDVFNMTTNSSDDNVENAEIYDLSIDMNKHNIFAA